MKKIVEQITIYQDDHIQQYQLSCSSFFFQDSNYYFVVVVEKVFIIKN